jgi:hypothetical protein
MCPLGFAAWRSQEFENLKMCQCDNKNNYRTLNAKDETRNIKRQTVKQFNISND